MGCDGGRSALMSPDGAGGGWGLSSDEEVDGRCDRDEQQDDKRSSRIPLCILSEPEYPQSYAHSQFQGHDEGFSLVAVTWIFIIISNKINHRFYQWKVASEGW